MILDGEVRVLGGSIIMLLFVLFSGCCLKDYMYFFETNYCISFIVVVGMINILYIE